MYDTFEVPNMISNATVSPRRIVTENTSQDITISMPNSQEFVKNVFISSTQVDIVISQDDSCYERTFEPRLRRSKSNKNHTFGQSSKCDDLFQL